MKNNSAKHDKSLINVLYLSIREEQSFLGYPWINYPPKSDEREKENSLQLVRSGSKFLDRNRREIGSLRTLLKIPNVVVRF